MKDEGDKMSRSKIKSSDELEGFPVGQIYKHYYLCEVREQHILLTEIEDRIKRFHANFEKLRPGLLPHAARPIVQEGKAALAECKFMMDELEAILELASVRKIERPALLSRALLRR